MPLNFVLSRKNKSDFSQKSDLLERSNKTLREKTRFLRKSSNNLYSCRFLLLNNKNKVMQEIISFKQRSVHLNFGRDIVRDWAGEINKSLAASAIKILDIGCGGNATDLKIASGQITSAKAYLFGVESYPPAIESARALGVNCKSQ